MTDWEEQRPDRTTMRGMIWNANHVLDKALDPETRGVPRSFFEQCRGVVLISLVEAGFIFTGSVGTGVVLARDRRTRRWSPPSALMLAGMGFGFIAGAELKDIIIVLMDDRSMKSVAGETQVQLGAQMSVTVGPVGREAEAQFNVSDHGPGTAFAWSFSRGLFGGVSFEGAVLEARSRSNERYYGRKVSPSEILFGDDKEEGEPLVEVPQCDEGVRELWEKLELLQAGKTRVPTPAQLEKKESMREEAAEAGKKAREEQADEVQYVDVKEEAEKEQEQEREQEGAEKEKERNNAGEEAEGGAEERKEEEQGSEEADSAPADAEK